MKQMIEKLKLLKENGITIEEESFVVMYDRYTDSFFLDVPEDNKQYVLDTGKKRYYWDASGLYPYEVEMGELTYDEVWSRLKPYSEGANLDLTLLWNGDGTGEHIYVDDDEEGIILVSTSDLITL